MPDNALLTIIVIVLTVAAAFLFIWKRRDHGIVPEDGLPEALHDVLERCARYKE